RRFAATTSSERRRRPPEAYDDDRSWRRRDRPALAQHRTMATARPARVGRRSGAGRALRRRDAALRRIAGTAGVDGAHRKADVVRRASQLRSALEAALETVRRDSRRPVGQSFARWRKGRALTPPSDP